MKKKTLWYVADPMCSWCWGFAPVIEGIREEYGDRLNFELLLGGLRPGTRNPISPEQRRGILHHWENVHRLTGQPFQLAGAMPEGFVYDTEPASRAVVTAFLLVPEVGFPFLKAVQHAFYAEQRDVTKTVVLVQLAHQAGLDTQQFAVTFESDAAKKLTLDHFNRARDLGISGFPTLLLEDHAGYHALTRGYVPFQQLSLKLEKWLGLQP